MTKMVRRNWRRCTGLFVALIALLCSAQSGYSANPAYQIGPRDVLTVSVFAGGEEQVKVDLTVSDQGMVNFPFIGSIQATGFSTSALEEKVKVPLGAEYFVDPQVHVQVKEYHSLQFSISGAVRKPGNFEMDSTTTLMDLIAKAEGVLAERGNVAYILRDGPAGKGKPGAVSPDGGSEPIKVNLIKLLDEGDLSHNVTLQSGDSVYIPLAKGLDQSESKVYVSGEVKTPGVYEYQPGLTALSACILAGGFSQFAASNRATIVRMEGSEQKIIKINLEDVTKGDKADIPLKPGDRLNIPESWL